MNRDTVIDALGKVVFVAMALFALGCPAFGDSSATLYGTLESGSNQSIQQITMNLTTGAATLTPVFPATSPDSIVFAGGGEVYTNISQGLVVLHTAGGDTTLASGIGSPADAAVTPDGTHVLVSGFGDGTIYSVSLSGGGKTALLSGVGNPQGLAFTPDGRLFANLGVRNNTVGGAPESYLAELDPTTGAIIAKTGLLYNLDGLTYDPSSGMLFAGQTFGDGFYEIDPNNLSNVNSSNVTILGASLTDSVDGIAADGLGNIFYVGEQAGNLELFDYDISSSTFTHSAGISGLDDIAPIVGTGAPPQVPEPASLGLLVSGLTALFVRRRF